jgi:thiol-disulfide isomerase/thioredoxin
MRVKLILALLICFNISQAQTTDTTLLIGTITKENLNHYSWYGTEYSKYVPDHTALEKIRPYVADLKIMVVMGTWCSDSHELIPAFFKLASQIGLPDSHIEMIAVDRKKKCPVPDVSSLHIEYVPTFFVFYKGKNVGKIVETPTKTLEADILDLLVK